jgi:DNA-binding transcriptional LysR family regulator
MPPPARDKTTTRDGEPSLRGLRAFVAVEETGSISAAAARLGASVSGISQHISSLEDALGAILFDRRARPVTLTPAGQVLRGHAHRILAAVAEARADLAEISLPSLPHLNLAIIDDLDASLTPVLVSGLQARFSRSFVHAFSGRSDQVLDRLRTRQADIVVTALPPTDGNAFHGIPLLREPFVLVTARGAIPPGEDRRAALLRLPFVQYSESIPIGQAVARQLRRVRLSPDRRYGFEATRSVLAMVVRTGGWTLSTPLNLLDSERFLPDVDISSPPFAGFTRQIYLVCRAGELGHLPDRLAQDCRAILRDEVLPRFAQIAPDLAAGLQILDDPGT